MLAVTALLAVMAGAAHGGWIAPEDPLSRLLDSAFLQPPARVGQSAVSAGVRWEQFDPLAPLSEGENGPKLSWARVFPGDASQCSSPGVLGQGYGSGSGLAIVPPETNFLPGFQSRLAVFERRLFRQPPVPLELLRPA